MLFSLFPTIGKPLGVSWGLDSCLWLELLSYWLLLMSQMRNCSTISLIVEEKILKWRLPRGCFCLETHDQFSLDKCYLTKYWIILISGIYHVDHGIHINPIFKFYLWKWLSQCTLNRLVWHTDSFNVSAGSYGNGEWVLDNSRPLYYSGFGCKRWLSAMWACRLTQRTDFSYEGYRWVPKDCDLPAFKGSTFLQRYLTSLSIFGYSEFDNV